MKKSKTLLDWEKATENLKDEFLKKYFDCLPDDVWWIGETFDVLAVNDYFFNLDRIYEALKYNASSKNLFEFYDIELEFAKKEKPMETNFRNYLKK